MSDTALPADRRAILGMLRDARARVYRDAESFDQAATTLEYIGQILAAEVRTGLGQYEKEILALAGKAPRLDTARLKELFHTVRRARNDSVHSGDFIRHHVLRLMELLLILEEAISMDGRIAEDLMVRNPSVAEHWHNIAAVRRIMLTNSFSYLPVKVLDGSWELISDSALVQYLRAADGNGAKNSLLGKTVEEVLDDSAIALIDCACFSPDECIDVVAKRISDKPVLIVDEQGHLLGILTAFDLL